VVERVISLGMLAMKACDASSHNCMKIVIDQNHVSGFLAHIGAVLAHGDSDVSSFQSDTVVDTIAGHPNDVACMLESFNNRQLVFRCDAIEHADVVDDFLQLHLIQLIDVMTTDGLLVDRVESDECC